MGKTFIIDKNNLIRINPGVNFNEFLKEFLAFLHNDSKFKELSIDFGKRVLQQRDFDNLNLVLERFNINLIGIYSNSPVTKMLYAENGIKILSGESLIHTGNNKKSYNRYNNRINQRLLDKVSYMNSDFVNNNILLNNSKQKNTVIVAKNLRSGVKIEYPGSVVIIGDVNPGSVIEAGGDIIVFGTLSGIAHAGRYGDINSIIVAVYMKTPQIKIANGIGFLSDEDLADNYMKVAYLDDENNIYLTTYDSFSFKFSNNNNNQR